MTRVHLPFWSFFVEIEKALSYERWIDKYRLFLDTLSGHHISYDKEWNQFRQFCKTLYLQDHRDEEIFDQLLFKAIGREQDWLASLLLNEEQQVDDDSPPGKANDKPIDTEKNDTEKNDDSTTESDPDKPASLPAKNTEQQRVDTENKKMYYRPPSIKESSLQKDKEKAATTYLQTDEYFSVSRRQMVKAWQFLRLKEKGRRQSGIDLMATIQQIARDGMFIEPKYEYATANREDTIIFFADYRGSMTPFHELTNRLISTARGEGGHPRASVYYFKNYPDGFVYQKNNLSEPIKTKQALIKTNRNFTLAIVISDAGAARGNTDAEAKNIRTKMTAGFLEYLDKSCAHTIWLNPMPVHRWNNTAAEMIRRKVFLMAPIMEQGQYDFQDMLRTVLKQELK